ncbi:hypothetical protein, partial [uncultured Streptococcus sp.]|uniref:hypothetical protein n=1 Tax=uncultured Streptococcus sp. TaxID=83427 RepID=UPI00259786B1
NGGSIPLGWSVIPIRKASSWLFLFGYAHKSLSVKSSELFKGTCRKLILDSVTSSLRVNKKPVIFTTDTYKKAYFKII